MPPFFIKIDTFVLLVLFPFMVYAHYAWGDNIMSTPQYKEAPESQINWEEITHGSIVQLAMHPAKINLIGNLPRSHNYTLRDLKTINEAINGLFRYKSDESNYWHSQSPEETITLGTGDCKALAVYKYNVLKQLGYKDVKILSVLVATGTGAIGGHVVVLLDEALVFDINPPYFYPYVLLKENNGILRAYDENHVLIIRGGEDD